MITDFIVCTHARTGKPCAIRLYGISKFVPTPKSAVGCSLERSYNLPDYVTCIEFDKGDPIYVVEKVPEILSQAPFKATQLSSESD